MRSFHAMARKDLTPKFLTPKFCDPEILFKTDAKESRQELSERLQSFEQKLAQLIKEFTEQLGVHFSELNKQQLTASQQAKTSIVEIREAIEKQLKAIREDNLHFVYKSRKLLNYHLPQLKVILDKQHRKVHNILSEISILYGLVNGCYLKTG